MHAHVPTYNVKGMGNSAMMYANVVQEWHEYVNYNQMNGETVVILDGGCLKDMEASLTVFACVKGFFDRVCMWEFEAIETCMKFQKHAGVDVRGYVSKVRAKEIIGWIMEFLEDSSSMEVDNKGDIEGSLNKFTWARHDKRKEVQTRLDFGESPKKIRRERENSLNSRAGNSPISITKSGPSRASSRDHSYSRGRSLSRDRHRIKDRLRGVEESYDDTYFSHGAGTKYKDRSRDRDRSCSVKRWRESESPPSRESESSTSDRGHWKSREKTRKPVDEEDLAVPWTCEDVDLFTPRIRNFKSSRTTRMPNNVKTYDGTRDPEHHLKIFQVATQQKKYVKNPVEIHNIKQRDEETIEEFMERFKIKTERIKGAPECMRISGFIHEVNNPELTKCLNEHIPKTVEEMMTATTAFIRGETAAASKKKVHTPWKSQDQSKRHTSERRSNFRNQPKDGRRPNKFTPLTRTPKEIFAVESGKFKPPPPMLIKQIEELKVTQSFARVKEITFPPLTANKGTEGPLVIETEIGGHAVHRMYVDGGSSMEVLYEHCFNRLRPEIKSQMVPTTTSLTGFSGETIWPLRQLRLLVTIGDAEHYTKAWMNFMIVRSLSPYNGIIGRHGIREIQAVPSTAHGMLKFPMNGGIVTIRSTILMPTECATIAATPKDSVKKTKARHENFKVAIHLDFPDQEITIEGTVSTKARTKLCTLLKGNLDIFAWEPFDMTGVPRSIAEHRLDIREGYPPVRQKNGGRPQSALRQSKIVTPFQKSIERSSPSAATPLSVSWTPIKAITKYIWRNKMRKRRLSTPVTRQIGQNLEIYVDDLVIKSHTKTELLRDIEETFCTLRKINMKLNPKKCTFGAAEGIFLGYMISLEGIKPCPDKTKAVLQLPSPRTIKEIQSLNGKLASLNRFLSKSAEKSLLLFKTLKKCIKKSDFHWTPEAEQAFKQLKQHLAKLPMLVAPKPKEKLIMYLSASYGAISAVLMTERDTVQTPVYFVSRALQALKLNYTPMEKLVLVLVCAAKRLRRYFQTHPNVVITEQPIKQGQILANFLVEKPDDAPPEASVIETPQEPWTLFTDRSSCVDGSGSGLILTSPEGMEFTYTLRFQFTASNNEAEYEALIAGLRIATQMGVRNVHVSVDSKLVANQVLGIYVAKEENMIKYLEKAKSLISGFANFSISQVPGSKNKKAGALSKIASTSFAHLSKHVLVEVLKEKSIQEREVATVVEEEGPTWMTPIIEYLRDETLPNDRKEASKLRIKARQYEFVGRDSLQTLVLEAMAKSIVAKAMRLGYYWPTMHRDARDMIRECNDCQIHHPVPRNPQQPLTLITAPWPFYKWGIDVAGPFPEGLGKVKFLIVAMDYFTKWIEAKAVATITGSQVKKFVWDNIVCRFGLPGEIVSDNEAVIPMEIRMPTYRTAVVDVVHNDEELRLNLDLLEERRERTAIREAKAKLKMTKYYNARVRGVTFRPGDFVYRSNEASYVADGGKLGPKWEGPYEVTEALRDGAYKLRSVDGTVLLRTWNITNLKKCYV
ncbi:reverse transcriptase domain-containing protein [Tanacetum coccineum]|uniref:Reverse transcriptase domain-containing protein n=1 Tax=Tanacetum coccineum TaxID=301880 RepID=A0ABQ5AF88_9ASTR